MLRITRLNQLAVKYAEMLEASIREEGLLEDHEEEFLRVSVEVHIEEPRERSNVTRRVIDYSARGEVYNQEISTLNLGVRAENCLRSVGITKVRDLVDKTDDELLRIRNFGKPTLLEVREVLKHLSN